MQYAFDTIMRVMVSAEDVSKNNIDEPFRYECLCCGEEVHIAAARSSRMTPHFRHLRGNSDKDCELYLGGLFQTGTGIESAIDAAQKRAHSRAEIQYDTAQHVFYFAVSFSEEKIEEYQNKECELEIRSGLDEAIRPVLINRMNFAPETQVRFPLDLSSNKCSITIRSRNNIGTPLSSYYEVLKPIDFPTFFKYQAHAEDQNITKRHTDGIIYTDTRYYIIAKQKSFIEKLYHYSQNVTVGQIEEISALGNVIFGAELTVETISDELADMMLYFGYLLKKAEHITVLWPPSYMVDGILRCPPGDLFLTSSFELKPRRNISCSSEQFFTNDDLYTIRLEDSLRISKSNGTVLQISSEKTETPVCHPEPRVEETTLVTVAEGRKYYYVGNEGCRLLQPGRYYLTESTKIVRCIGNYPETIYTLPNAHEKSPIKKLMEIRKYYNVMIPFTEDLVSGLSVSKVAEIYLEDCKKTGTINEKALDYIKAGLI